MDKTEIDGAFDFALDAIESVNRRLGALSGYVGQNVANLLTKAKSDIENLRKTIICLKDESDKDYANE